MGKFKLNFNNVGHVKKVNLSGVILAALFVLGIELINRYSPIRIQTPGIILTIPIIYSILTSGFYTGLAAALVSIAYTSYFYSGDSPFRYTGEQAQLMVVVNMGILMLTALTGSFRKNYEHVQKESLEAKMENLQQEKFSTFANAIPHLIWTTDAEGRVNFYNKQWCEYVGLDKEQCLVKSPKEFIHPEDYTKIHQAWLKVKDKGGLYEVEGRLKNSQGQYRWFLTRAVPLRGHRRKIMSWLATATDIHERKVFETKLKVQEATVRDSEERYREMVEQSPISVQIVSPDGRVLRVNRAWEELWGGTMEDLKGYNIFEDPQLRFLGVTSVLARAKNGETVSAEPVRYVPDRGLYKGKGIWVQAHVYPLKDETGEVREIVLMHQDITEQKEADENIERSLRRQQFLAEAGEILSSSLQYESTLKKVTDLVVPRLADWAAVDMLEPNGNIRRLAVAHQDPSKVNLAYELQQKVSSSLEADGAISLVLRTGKPQFIPAVSDALLVEHAKDTEHLDMMRAIGFTSLIIVPLLILGKPVGTITLVSAKSRINFNEEDLKLAEELARRASIAIQNAKLFAEVQDTAMREHEQAVLLNTLLDRAPIGFALLDTNFRFLRINRVLAEMNGLPAHSHLGKSVRELLPRLAEQAEPLLREVLRTNEPVLDVELKGETPARPGILRQWVESFYPVHTKDGKLLGIGVVANEVTEQKEAQKEIHYRAYYDVLTGLPNRKSLEEQVMKVLHYSKHEQKKFAVMFLDVDRLKNINDTLGHEVGDIVLKETANRLVSAVRPGDLVSRWAGDEFVVLVPDIYGASEVMKISDKILAAMEPVIRVGSNSIHSSVSIGIALFPNDGEDLHTLHRNADTALYRAKDAGKNRYELYDAMMNFKAAERLQLEHDLREAVRKQQFVLYFQPILDIKTDTVLSFETLIRWRHPIKGLLKPSEFLDLAEEHGLIIPIGKWVLKHTCRVIKRLEEMGFRIRASVNVSARQFVSEDLTDTILDIIKESEVDPSLIELEITENLAMENIERTRHVLKVLKDAGLSITIDDFGTGYSSLNYLKRFPVNTLKIDKSFIRGSITNEQDSSIIRAIVSLAKNLHLRVVAEGVTTEMQLNFLASLGCDAAQGLYIARPLSYRELVEFVKERQQPEQVVHIEVKNPS